MAKSMKRIHKVTITDMEATMTHTSKGELSDLNLTSMLKTLAMVA